MILDLMRSSISDSAPSTRRLTWPPAQVWVSWCNYLANLGYKVDEYRSQSLRLCAHGSYLDTVECGESRLKDGHREDMRSA